MSVVRRSPLLPFTATGLVAEDTTLSFTARGIAFYLSWRIFDTGGDPIDFGEVLAASPDDDDEVIMSALDELLTEGYLIKKGNDWFFAGLAKVPVRPRDDSEEHPKVRYEPHVKVGTIYFVTRENLIKIGFTTNLTARLKSISGTMPPGMTVGPVELLATQTGTMRDERALHERFHATRIDNTEWFRPSRALRAYIASLEVAA